MDYCTFWFEGWWQHCCKAHDDDYLSQVGKSLADERLFQCALTASDNPVLAIAGLLIGGAMFAAVRIFGHRFYKQK